ncbi:MAG: ribosome small subunit-dependent GTPase A [Balneolales bacterium]|nr:ribosome small subunit-dependent GTPase A [Balneolales bacterium]
MIYGRVIKSTGKWYKVISCTDNGQPVEGAEVIMCQLPGKFRLMEIQQTNPLAVGDFVDFTMLDDGGGMVQHIHERENRISRKATHGRKGEQILVSNVDQAFVIQALAQPAYRTGFIDRFIVTAEAFGVKPLIVLNKADLGKESDAESIGRLIDLYESLGYSLILTSIFDEESIKELQGLMKDKTSVFIGPSGTGKTSLLNAIQPGLDRTVGEVSTFSQKGKHTTTYAELIPLDTGGYVVDTPGIREFGLIYLEPAEIASYFVELKPLREKCRYYNCTHLHEPGCAVMEAFDRGEISASRYNSYISMFESLEDEIKSAGSRKR